MIYNDLAIFVCVAKSLSFSAAAERLGTPASRVSRRISDLEEQLETRLFERTTRRVRLTHEGQQLLHQCEAPFESLRETLSSGLSKGPDSKRRIRVTTSALAARTTVGPKILQFLQNNPEISLEMLTTNHYLDFIRDDIDIAFRFGPLKSAEVIARKLWEVPYSLCATRNFIQRHGIHPRLSAEELSALPAISGGPAWSFEQAPNLEMRNIRHVIDDLNLARDAVEQEMGIGFLPTDMVTGKLEKITLKNLTPTHRYMYAVYPSKRFLPKRVRELLDWMANSD